MILVALCSFALLSAVAVGDLLLTGVAVAFLFGMAAAKGAKFHAVAWCIPCVLVVVGIVLKPFSLLAAPLAVGTSFAAHQ